MIDAILRSAEYAFLIENKPDQKTQWKKKTYAPVALGSKIFSHVQLTMSI